MDPWTDQVSEAIAALDEAPQFGQLRPFPWEALQEKLCALFGRSELTLAHKDHGWMTPKSPEGGFLFSINCAPLESSLYFFLGEQEMRRLMILLFNGEEGAAPFLDREHIEGFAQFFALELLEAIDELGYVEGLVPRLGKATTLPEGPAFVSDLSLKIGKQTMGGRLYIPDAFRQGWKRHGATLPPLPLSSEMAQKIPVDIALEVGKSELTLGEWKGVKPGDFVLLDRATFDPQTKKGRVILTLDGHPLFRGKLTDAGLKLLEYPLYEEVRAMDDEKLEAGEEGDDLYGDVGAKTPLTPETLPIQLTVEVGRLRMSAQELLNLSPGNLIELPVAPEQGVDLVVNGKRVGKGELIKMGEVLGVRILRL